MAKKLPPKKAAVTKPAAPKKKPASAPVSTKGKTSASKAKTPPPPVAKPKAAPPRPATAKKPSSSKIAATAPLPPSSNQAKSTETPPPPVIAAPKPDQLAPPPLSSLPKTVPLTVNVQTSQGMAAAGNTQPANILVIVTSAGWPVTELDQNHFTLMEHFEVPGQTAPFSNSITSFRNAGTGAYLLQTRPINGAPWRSGHHLGQLLVSNSEDQQGQAAFKLIIR